MRLISFKLTTDQIRQRTKTVTRRVGWRNLKAGDVLMGVVTCMGLKKGEAVEKLGAIRVVDVRREPLAAIIDEPGGAAREGFPELTEAEFVAMFCRHMKCDPSIEVTRIEFAYTDPPLQRELF